MQRLSKFGPVNNSEPSRQSGALRTLATMLTVSVLVAGCGGGSMADLKSYIEQMKNRPGTPIEPLPPIDPYVTYAYPCDGAVPCVDPFAPFHTEPPDPCADPNSRCDQIAVGGGPTPNFDRNREELESYPLDALRMMGTLEKGDQFWAILRDPNTIIHRVQAGNYIGQNHGKIIEVTENMIQLLEIIPDGRGGWEEREAEMALSE